MMGTAFDDAFRTAHFATRCERIGFSAPPTDVRVRVLPRGPGGDLLVHSPSSAHREAMTSWLGSMGPDTVQSGPRGVQRATYGTLPTAWSRIFAGVTIEMLDLRPTGEARVCATGPREWLQRLASELAPAGDDVTLIRIGPVYRAVPLLTVAQDEALRGAMMAGYYQIPRPLNLNNLAKSFGVSPSSLSERLRRAEARVILRYVDDLTTSPDGDALT